MKKTLIAVLSAVVSGSLAAAVIIGLVKRHKAKELVEEVVED